MNQAGPEPQPDFEPWEPDSLPSNVTIFDVAKRAGVSIATVSQAMNRPGRVAEPTRFRVLTAADQLGFRPRRRSPGAGAASRPKRIAVIGPMSRHDTYLARLIGILRQAEADFLDIIPIDNSRSPDPHLIDALPLRSRVDGVIIMGARISPRLEENLLARRISTLLLDGMSERHSSVTVDDAAGGRLVAEHLLGLGCLTTCLVSPAPEENTVVTSGELRFHAFTDALRAAGVAEEVSWVIADDTFKSGQEAARELASGALPDAVFGIHDRVAAGLMAGFMALGIRVPQDIRVVGYDDVELAACFDLTTVHQPFAESGMVALQTLHAQILDPSRPLAHVMLRPTLVPRTSTIGPNPQETPNE